ncbi:MAG: TatD family hydrolase [Oleibacter sp.]|nr:TatD family hydrolase [Thalassolituus sp.]
MTAQWFDSHCHFDFSDFDDDRLEVWTRANNSGVGGLLIPGVSRQQGQRLEFFCQQNSYWFYTLGLHPYWAGKHKEDDADWLLAAAQNDKVVAIGECGVDRPLSKRSEITWQQQWQWFELQLDIAHQLKKPLVLHAVGSHDEMAAAIQRQGFTSGGLVHAFSGSATQARRWNELGFKLGFGASATNPNAGRLRALFADIPLANILLESDAPDMAPTFWSNNRNSPEVIPMFAAQLASLRHCTHDALAVQLQHNLVETFPNLHTLGVLP